jgi:thiamine biosynthesis lipoprotein
VTLTLSTATFPALGSTATVVVGGDDGALAAAVDTVRAELAAVDLACSRFRVDSELSRLNNSRGRPTPASPLLLDAVTVALRAARLTGGLVDPTVGTALRHLGYDRDIRAVQAAQDQPSPGVPLVTLVTGPVPGWQSVTVDRVRRTVSLLAGVELDLGATAKALAADRAAASARRFARCGVLVSLGGDVAVAGPAPAGGWSIRATDDHAAPADAPGQTISIESGGLATSGTTVRRWRHGDIEVHHLIDPGTGQPAGPTWRTVSVAAASCVDANTASTAAVILGPAAPEWLAARGLPARLVAPDGTVTLVAGWPEP